MLLAGAAVIVVNAPSGASKTDPSPGHPFYISICQIDHNPDTRALEIAVRIFTDDLEQALESMGTDRLHLGTEREAEKADLYIGRYLAQQVVLEINGIRTEAVYLGKEVDDDGTWCFVEIGDIPELKTMTMTNTLLLETFEDQVNLVHVKAHDQKKSLIFNSQMVKQTLEF